ncbi:hypothetical protein [Desertivibrio insolitus]|nr:hypothetical protein [Herbiconiux sp. SYSU D00978]
MTDAARDERPALTLLGDPDAVVCEGDVCAVPALDERAIVKQRLDAGLI